MITAGPIYPGPVYHGPFSDPPCDVADCGPRGGSIARFGPAVFDQYGAAAILLSVPGFDTRGASPYGAVSAAPGGPVANAGYRGGSSRGYPAVAGAPGVNRSYSPAAGSGASCAYPLGFPGFAGWSDGRTSGRDQTAYAGPAPDHHTAAFRGVFWVGVGLLAGALLRKRGRFA